MVYRVIEWVSLNYKRSSCFYRYGVCFYMKHYSSAIGCYTLQQTVVEYAAYSIPRIGKNARLKRKCCSTHTILQPRLPPFLRVSTLARAIRGTVYSVIIRRGAAASPNETRTSKRLINAAAGFIFSSFLPRRSRDFGGQKKGARLDREFIVLLYV